MTGSRPSSSSARFKNGASTFRSSGIAGPTGCAIARWTASLKHNDGRHLMTSLCIKVTQLSVLARRTGGARCGVCTDNVLHAVAVAGESEGGGCVQELLAGGRELPAAGCVHECAARLDAVQGGVWPSPNAATGVREAEGAYVQRPGGRLPWCVQWPRTSPQTRLRRSMAAWPTTTRCLCSTAHTYAA
jgi:hypothetical protein